MPTPQIKPSTFGLAAIAALAAGGLIGARYFSLKKVSSAERLCDALLDSEPLKQALETPSALSEKRLALCAEYFLTVNRKASEGVGVANAQSDPVGHNRVQSHKYTGAVVSLVTESNSPEQSLSYSVRIPGVGEATGTRQVGGMRMSGIYPAYPTPESVQIQLEDGYTAQIESELQVTDTLLTGRARLFGVVTLRDNQGNVGRLHLGSEETLTGSITRNSQVVGRFDGSLPGNIRFTPYQIQGS